MPDWHAIAGAVVAGIVTSISPCPLATNIAAIAFLGRRSGQGRRVAWAGLAYTAGRAVAYTGIAAAIIGGLLSTPAMSEILRTKLAGLVGPLLILTGMVVAGWLPLRLPGSSKLNVWGQQLAKRGLEIAAAGGHNILFIGPPGTGKSMLAQRLPGILPRMSDRQAIETAAVDSVLGRPIDISRWRQRPGRHRLT